MPQNSSDLTVAYFSLEMMLESDIPTYAGGLGVLAGDILRSCADMKVPAVGVSLIYSGSSSRQIINSDGTQTFAETDWQKLDQLVKLPNRVEITIDSKKVLVDCWRYEFVGQGNFLVPVYLLDTDFPENEAWVRTISKSLYGGDGSIRLSQEILLGMGGVKMLEDLGYKQINCYHLNEGHAAFVPLALLPEKDYQDEAVRKLVAFTTHTPVPEGHDHFDYQLAHKLAGDYLPWHIQKLATEGSLSMTDLALNMSKISFAVSKKHQAVSSHLFPGHKFDYVTNGVHHLSWVHSFLQDLYNKHLPGWVEDPSLLKSAVEKLPDDALWWIHQECKKELIDYVNHHLTSISTLDEKKKPRNEELFDLDTLTISLARRPVAYKRPLLLYSDLERFVRIGVGRIQIIQCGKSHPDDVVSQGFVKEIIQISKKFKGILRVVYLENYSPLVARMLVSGSDIWLNTPRRPLEASGTSGMKAALNGVINFSVLDGWWIEGVSLIPNSGFSIGPLSDLVTPNNHDSDDASDLYLKLEDEIIPKYYDSHTEWVKMMKSSISLGSHFNTHRVVKEYLKKAWEN